MRIGVFSDIHGNPYACEAVLQAITVDGHFDTIVAAGDLCLGGSDPAKCVDLLEGSGVEAVYGNTDEYIFEPEKEPGDDLHRTKWRCASLPILLYKCWKYPQKLLVGYLAQRTFPIFSR